MTARVTIAFLLCSIVLSGVLGCRRGDPDQPVAITSDPKPYMPRADSQDAFDSYSIAAQDAEQSGARYLDRVSFFPGQKDAVTKAISPSVKRVVDATKYECHFQFSPHKPFTIPPFERGWRLIGRVITWNVENACASGDFETAISNAIIGTTFGLDLTGGGATDASLGFGIADDVRKSIAPYLPKMTATQLDRLAQGIKVALSRKPPITDALKNEHENMLQSIQFIQDCMAKGDTKTLRDQMGPDINEAVRYIDQIHANERKRLEFVSALEKAGEAEFDTVTKDAASPVKDRRTVITEYTGQWRKLPKHFLGSARPLLALNDATTARTKLLILTAEILKMNREKKPYPSSLAAFSNDLTIDPYSGVPFVYQDNESEFKLYSVGANGRDDGGDSDETYTSPDLKLECPSL